LTAEKPIWDLSVYGPAKEEPNLIVGTDRSFEEDRLRYYLSRIQTGNETQFVGYLFQYVIMLHEMG
jgi:nucleoporin NUP42